MAEENSFSVKAFAKLNLTMEVLNKREDNYHNIRSLMQFVSLYDTIEFKESENISFECNDVSIQDENNLVVKAFKSIQEYMETRGINIPNMNIYLDKKVPYMSGMGSGSSDGAMVLHAINRRYNCNLTLSELCDLGKTLGADFPACIYGNTLVAEGIGEKIQPLKIDSVNYYVVIKPKEAFSTAQMYKKIDDRVIYSKENYTDAVINAIKYGKKPDLYNTFEFVAEPIGLVEKYKEMLSDAGAISSSMTGAGSAFFGIFRDEQSAKKAKEILDSKNAKNEYSTYCCRTMCDTINVALEELDKIVY